MLAKIAAGATQGVQDAAQAGMNISLAIVPRDTGELADSIQMQTGGDDSSAWAAWGPNTFYDFYVEYGTGKRGAASALAGPGPYSSTWPGQAPEPYMRPAMDEISGQVLDIVGGAIKSVL